MMPRIENPKQFLGLTSEEIARLLPGDCFVVVTNTVPWPTGWPRQIRVELHTIEGGSSIVWGMNLKGREWEPFYAFGVEAYAKLRVTPGFVYERAGTGDEVSYTPVISLMFDSQGRCTASSKEWCDQVRRAPPFTKLPGSSWPWYEDQAK